MNHFAFGFTVFATFFFGASYLCGAFIAWDTAWITQAASWEAGARGALLFLVLTLFGVSVAAAADFARWAIKKDATH